jgi:cellobiose-specific phosphotransferase system component IIB
MSEKTLLDQPVPKSLIDLAQHSKNSFDSVFLGFKLSKLLDDVLLTEFADETESGELKRGNIIVSTNTQTNAWRVGKIILAGPNVRFTKPGDYIIFPNNLGIKISNIQVKGYGNLKSGLLINEQRIFGLSEPIDNLKETVYKERKEKVENISRISKKSATK